MTPAELAALGQRIADTHTPASPPPPARDLEEPEQAFAASSARASTPEKIDALRIAGRQTAGR